MLKRLFDIVVSALLLLILAVFMAAIALAVKIAMSGPVLFRGTRIGRDERQFRMLKFRSMLVSKNGTEPPSTTAGDDSRVTPFGRWLRRYKVDELPQLWNVLVGDMSLVGPRPQVPWIVDRYTEQEKVLLTVRPGITDPASLRFANQGDVVRRHADPDRAYFELIHPEKMRLSIWYLQNRSFLRDLKILVATTGVVLGRRPGRTGLPETDLMAAAVNVANHQVARAERDDSFVEEATRVGMSKRVFDVVVSVILLLGLSVFMAAISLAIKVATSGPVLFRGTRIGRDGRQFRILKFRSMVAGADRLGASSTADDDPRMTRIGKWMRGYKIDEIPQLWNVLVGDMSLVGPRPQVPWAVERYTESEKILLTVRPGITDPASLRFANEGEILRGHSDPDRAYLELIHPEKMRLSIVYVRNRSFFGDLMILFATVRAALARRSAATILPEGDSSTT
jgi:lipopolysaccharide/colanic/teichoic acid biosynthesis glycosyltransferase